jgi:hypothetical protein
VLETISEPKEVALDAAKEGDGDPPAGPVAATPRHVQASAIRRSSTSSGRSLRHHLEFS